MLDIFRKKKGMTMKLRPYTEYLIRNIFSWKNMQKISTKS